MYLLGYLASIQVIYRMLANHQLAEINKHNTSTRMKQLEQGDVVQAAMGATFLSLFWVLGLPWVLSYLVRNVRRPSVAREAERLTDNFQHAREMQMMAERVKKSLAQETTGDQLPSPARLRPPNRQYTD